MLGDTAFGQGEVVGCRTISSSLADGDEVGNSDYVAGVVAIAKYYSEIGRAFNSRIIIDSILDLCIAVRKKNIIQPAVRTGFHRGYAISIIELKEGTIWRVIIDIVRVTIAKVH